MAFGGGQLPMVPKIPPTYCMIRVTIIGYARLAGIVGIFERKDFVVKKSLVFLVVVAYMAGGQDRKAYDDCSAWLHPDVCPVMPITMVPKPVAPMAMTYEASTERVFGALVQAVSTFEIKTALKDGCLLKFSTLRPFDEWEKRFNQRNEEANALIRRLRAQSPQLAGPELPSLDVRKPVDWTILCSGLDGGKTSVTIRATKQIGVAGNGEYAVVPDALSATDPDRAIAIQIISSIWSSLDHALRSAVAPEVK
jgi:hypothetical protein